MAGLSYVTDAELSARLTKIKTTSQRAWLGDVSAAVLQQALADLNVACRNFSASAKGTRKGPKIGPPRFRSRKVSLWSAGKTGGYAPAQRCEAGTHPKPRREVA
jgi:transposase